MLSKAYVTHARASTLEVTVGELTQIHDTAWQARYQYATERLNDARWLLQLQKMLRDTSADVGGVSFLSTTPHASGAKRVAVFTGSFNPLTLAHVAVADVARTTLSLDTLIWALSRVTVDKERVARAMLLDRIAQVLLFTAREGCGDQVALLNAGLYVDQARTLRRVLAPHTTLYFVVGFDKIEQILDPRYYADRDASLTELFALCELSVSPRAGSDIRAMKALVAQPENRPYAGWIHHLPVSARVAGISSTLVRERAAACSVSGGPALADVVPPEGAALACSTSAYRQVSQPEAGTEEASGDLYGWRQHWLAALGATAWNGTANVHTLAERTAEQSARGEAARRWLARTQVKASAGDITAVLRDLLA